MDLLLESFLEKARIQLDTYQKIEGQLARALINICDDLLKENRKLEQEVQELKSENEDLNYELIEEYPE